MRLSSVNLCRDAFDTGMGLPLKLMEQLSSMPQQLEDVLRLVPAPYLNWKPDVWDGTPGEMFSVVEQVCHLRDIEIEGYHQRIWRLLNEDYPHLDSLDGYLLARERSYFQTTPTDALFTFCAARFNTIKILKGLRQEQLALRGTFAEYGPVTMLGLVHFLRSHDQQHLSSIHWLLGKIHSR
jgi:hypothetical protein